MVDMLGAMWVLLFHEEYEYVCMRESMQKERERV